MARFTGFVSLGSLVMFSLLDWSGVLTRFAVGQILVSFSVFTGTLWVFLIAIKKNAFKLICYRFFEAVLTVLVILTSTFFLMRELPGGPFDDEVSLSPTMKSALEKQYNLDRPLLEQYIIFVRQAFSGNLGESMKNPGQSINEVVREVLPETIRLGFYALVFSLMIGVPLGVFSAARNGSAADHVIRLLTVLIMSSPVFLVAPCLIIVFSFWFDLLPPALWDGPMYYILPVLTLCLRPMATVIRIVRVSMLDVIGSDYIRTAFAKGLRERTVLFQHALKNSLIPLISIIGPLVAGLLSGSFVVESIFAIPGLGRYLIEGVFNRDYPVVIAMTLIYSTLLILANLISDLFLIIVDPRVKLA